jgi:hypothetical protein
MFAALFGHTEIIEILKNAGATVNIDKIIPAE